uniref:Uncharacterized protein n=1 Tax=Oryza sativa subsp. japonica TaxID=39947 RepID=Q10H29_ORYSJ|nr:hypothetical protein LOC_Os03g40749 [Oryza sativa Japonica Group]
MASRTPRAPLLATRVGVAPPVASASSCVTTPLAASRVANRVLPARAVARPGDTAGSCSNSDDRSKPSDREIRWNRVQTSGGIAMRVPASARGRR